jgi:hypothetical protein
MTVSQIFKEQVPSAELFALLEKICQKTEHQYQFDTESYKSGMFSGELPAFVKMCEPFYHNAKRVYLTRTLTYKSFTTILRQICKCNGIPLHSKIKYDKSQYEIVYFVGGCCVSLADETAATGDEGVAI